MLEPAGRQTSLIARQRFGSDVIPGREDPIPILDGGYPRSVGGIKSAAEFCLALGTQFELRPLDCDPFFHDYGRKYSEAEITIEILELPFTDIIGKKVIITFYTTDRDGFLSLGNEIQHQSTQDGQEDPLIILPNTESFGIFFSKYRSLYSSKQLITKKRMSNGKIC